MVDLFGHIDGLGFHHQLDEVNDDVMRMMEFFVVVVAGDDIEMYYVDRTMIDPLDLMHEHLQWPKIVDSILVYHESMMMKMLSSKKLVYLFSTMMLSVL